MIEYGNLVLIMLLYQCFCIVLFKVGDNFEGGESRQIFLKRRKRDEASVQAFPDFSTRYELFQANDNTLLDTGI